MVSYNKFPYLEFQKLAAIHNYVYNFNKLIVYVIQYMFIVIIYNSTNLH
jgi:hypothetical protein